MRPPRRVGALLLGALLLSAAVLAEGGSGSSKGKKSSSKKKGSKKPATLEVTIPEGARAGDKLNFVTPSNQEFYVKVPEGGSPGQRFNLQLPDGVKKARMKKFYPPKRRNKKNSGGKGDKDGSGSKKSKPKGPTAPVVAIDFGNEIIKIAVETDFPDPMVLNMQGGRTTPNVLALQDDEIFFGDIAVSLQQRVNTSYVHTKQLLGRRADETGPKDTDPSGGPPWFQAMGLRYDVVPDQRGTVRLPDGKRCEPDRAIVIGSAKRLMPGGCMQNEQGEIANAHLRQHQRAGEKSISPHFAIAVPVWWTKIQRSAMQDAARLAGLEPVTLVSDNVALAYKYAISRNPREIMEAKLHKKRKDDVHHALLYDIGSTSATASLVRVSVSTKTKGRKMSVVETVDVKAVAWSSFLGGRSFDRRLSGLLAERYNSLQAELGATSFDVRDDPRAMATLLREAARTKEKLSANKELAVSVEGLPSNVAEFGDLKTVVTRAEFEELTADLVEELLVPVRRVLDETGLPKSVLDAVTLVGGGSRVPIIQEKLKKLLKRENLDSKLNGDEAVATGLAAYGASQSQGKEFRRDLKIVHTPFPAGLSPSRSQLVEPLQGQAWDEAAATIEKLTRKAAALAAHQQALSDYEALLFRWEEKLNSDAAWEEAEEKEDSESSEEAEVEEESSSWFSGYGSEDSEAAEIDDVAGVDNDLSESDNGAATSIDVEPAAEMTEEEKAAAAEAEAAAAKAVEEQMLLVATGREWLDANSATASTEELLAQLQDLDIALNELEPEVEPEEEDWPSEEEDSSREEEGDGLTDAERQHAILHHFYAKYAPKTETEVEELIAKRKGDSDSLSEKTFEELCRKLEDKYGENPTSLYAIDRAMGMLDEDDTDSATARESADDLIEDDNNVFSDEEAAQLDQKQREKQISILHSFYAKYSPKSEDEVADIITKRSMSGERSLRPAKFDELCDKLADKYGENPESVWRETVGDDIADDAGEVDWDALFDEEDSEGTADKEL